MWDVCEEQSGAVKTRVRHICMWWFVATAAAAAAAVDRTRRFFLPVYNNFLPVYYNQDRWESQKG